MASMLSSMSPRCLDVVDRRDERGSKKEEVRETEIARV